MARNEAIRRIRAALKQRSGKTWSVTGGRGTSWGWITIEAPPARRVGFGYTSPEDCAELIALLGTSRKAGDYHQGVHIPSGGDYRQEYVDRAEGRPPSVIGSQYWD